MTEHSNIFALFNEIGIINQLSSAAFSSVMPDGMTLAQFGVLNHFVRLKLGPQAPKDLASAFQVTRATMTSTLTRMERAGLIAIAPNPHDGRGKLVSITQTGEAMREHCLAQMKGPIEKAQAAIDSDDVTALLPLLTQLRTKLDNLRG